MPALVGGLTSSTAVLTATQMVVMMAGSMLINAVFPPPGMPSTADPSAASPTYSLQSQGNAARLGAPIPVNYGTMRVYPDFAAQPYTEYHGNDQYLYQLFCIGQGRNRVSALRLDNTPLDNFEDVTTEVIPPLGRVTLFHSAVINAPEAGGQDMSNIITLGPYVINAVGTQVSRLSVDIVMPGGLFGVDKHGHEYNLWLELDITADAIDGEGKVTGDSFTVFRGKIWDRTRTAIRRSLSKDVPPGRYRVTVKRLKRKGYSNESDSCTLGNIRGYLVDDNEYGDVTLLAVRIRATANLSNSASRLLNCLVEREIPVWEPSGGWSDPVLTDNPAWCFADAARARYGGDFPDSEVDLNGLHYLAGVLEERGDGFNGRFDSNQSLWDGLGKVGQVCRCAPVRQGNLLRMIRDQHQFTPATQFSMANMSDFSMDFVMHNGRTADSVKVTYWDKKRDFKETTILCRLPDETADNPKDIKLFGCTGYEQAWREGMYLAAGNRERRQLVSWKTGMEGYIPTFGDVVWVNHDLLGAGQVFSGTVAGEDGTALLLSRDVSLPGDHWYMVLRDGDGTPSQPLSVEGMEGNRVRLLDRLPFAVETDMEREPTHFMIGRGKNYAWPVKVTGIVPEADDRITVSGCIESEYVHTADQGTLPPHPPDVVPPPVGLSVEGLISTQGGTRQNPVVFLSWQLAHGADRYLVELSRDGRQTWQPAGTGVSLLPQHEFTAQPGLVTCRVAAVAAVRGDWAMVDVNAGGEFDRPGQVAVSLMQPFTGDALSVVWEKEPAAARYLIEVLYKGQRMRAMYVERSVTDYSYHWQDARQDGAGRELTVRVRAQNAENVDGEWGSVTASNPSPPVPGELSITSLIDAFVIRATRATDTDIREFRVYGSREKGFVPDAATLLGAGQTPVVNLNLKGEWYFRCAWVDQWGEDGLNFSGEAAAESDFVDLSDLEGIFPITETEIKDGSISTPKLQANCINGDKIQANSINAGHLKADSISARHLQANSITGQKISSSTTITAGVEAGMNGAEYPDNPALGNIRFWSGASADEVDKANFAVDRQGLMRAANANISGVLASSSITGTDIAGGTVTGTQVNGSRINGAVIEGSTIIGGLVIASETAYTVDPSDDGTIRYYDAYPDHIVYCNRRFNERQSVKRINQQERDIVLSSGVKTAADFTGEPTSQRFRWLDLPRAAIVIELIVGGDHDDMTHQMTLEYFNPDTGKVMESKVLDFQNWNLPKNFNFTFAGIRFKGTRKGFHNYATSMPASLGSLTDPSKNGCLRLRYRCWSHNQWYTSNLYLTVATDNSIHP